MKPISKKHTKAQNLLSWLEEKQKVLSDQATGLYNRPRKLYKFLEGLGYKYYTLEGWQKI
jgi:hypothetical protein